MGEKGVRSHLEQVHGESPRITRISLLSTQLPTCQQAASRWSISEQTSLLRQPTPWRTQELLRLPGAGLLRELPACLRAGSILRDRDGGKIPLQTPPGCHGLAPHPHTLVRTSWSHRSWCSDGRELVCLSASSRHDSGHPKGLSGSLSWHSQPFLGALLATQRFSSTVCAPLWQLWSDSAWLAGVGSS